MDKVQKIKSTITSLARFYEKNWNGVKINRIADYLSQDNEPKDIEKAINRIYRSEDELPSNPIPIIIAKVWATKRHTEEIEPIEYDYE